MTNIKVIIGGAIVLVLAIVGLVVWMLSAGRDNNTLDNTPPPPISEQENTSDAWRLYDAEAGKYGISLPPTWFVDQDTVVGGGASLLFSNDSAMNLQNPSTVVVEIFPFMKKKAGDSLFTAVKAGGLKDGNFGLTKATATQTGYEVFYVEHAYGRSTDGPGYAVKRSNTEYLFAVASSGAESEIVDRIVNSIVFAK